MNTPTCTCGHPKYRHNKTRCLSEYNAPQFAPDCPCTKYVEAKPETFDDYLDEQEAETPGFKKEVEKEAERLANQAKPLKRKKKVGDE